MPHAIRPAVQAEEAGKYNDVVQEMLSKGREIKSGGGFEPSISRADIQTDLEAFKGVAASGAVEAALRKSFYHILASTSMDQPEFVDMWSLLDVCLVLSDDGICEVGLTFWLVEELLESQVIEHCQRVFDYLEVRREAMVAKHMGTKKLIILRACNELLKRLSRAEDTVFCGRVFIYLFESLAFGDRSAVNLRGEFHVDNVTIFEQADTEPEAITMELDPTEPASGIEHLADEKPGDQVSSEGASKPTIRIQEPQDSNQLYHLFWSLQQYFCKPTTLFEAETLLAFKKGMEDTLAKFKAVQKDGDARGGAASNEDPRPSSKRKWEEVNDGVNNFNPKYLTSRDLFDLEINDLAFRRHIMVQGLILMDFLLSQTPKAKTKLEALKNKSVIYSFTLSDEDAQWAERTRAEIANYLQQGAEGKFYYRMVDTVLSRDKNWVFWKAESCPSFSRGSIPAPQYVEARDGAQKSSASKRLRPAPMGSLDLSFLEESSGDGLANLTEPERYSIPASDGYRMAINDDDFEIDMAKTEDEKKAVSEAKSSKIWRTLRIASRTKFKDFDKVDDGNKLDVLFKSPDDQQGDEDKEEREEAGQDGTQDKGEEGETEQKEFGSDQEAGPDGNPEDTSAESKPIEQVAEAAAT